MKALEALHSRTSIPRLGQNLPNQEVLDNIYKAAVRAADHGLLRPWRFLIVTGKSRHRLSQLFVDAGLSDDPQLGEQAIAKLRQKPLRAPLLIVTISSVQDHPKIPAIEQEYSAAAATQNMLVAAHAQGVGSMWRTGSMSYHPVVKSGLGLTANEKIIGFLYIGSIGDNYRPLNETKIASYFKDW